MRRRLLKKQIKNEIKTTINTKEVGLWGRSVGKYEVDRDKYQYRFIDLLSKSGYDNYGCLLTEKDGSFDEPNPNFIVRPYCWDDDSLECLLPNFECPKLKFKLTWYKYALRSAYSNIKLTEDLMEKLESLI